MQFLRRQSGQCLSSFRSGGFSYTLLSAPLLRRKEWFPCVLWCTHNTTPHNSTSGWAMQSLSWRPPNVALTCKGIMMLHRCCMWHRSIYIGWKERDREETESKTGLAAPHSLPYAFSSSSPSNQHARMGQSLYWHSSADFSGVLPGELGPQLLHCSSRLHPIHLSSPPSSQVTSRGGRESCQTLTKILCKSY